MDTKDVPAPRKLRVTEVIKPIVKGKYQLQKLRIQCGLRIVAHFKVKLGQEPSHTEKELTAEAQEILKTLRLEYRRITDAIVSKPEAYFKDNICSTGLISSLAEYALVSQYMQLEKSEAEQDKYLAQILATIPIYTRYLSKIAGVGPAMAGVIISEFDIWKSNYPSSMVKYAGIDIGPDGRGRGKYKEHLEPKKYIDSEGKVTETVGITFNPFLKSKLLGVLANSFIRLKTSHYRSVYDDKKNQYKNNPAHKDKSPAHINNMAKRYLIKIFLYDLYKNWRTLEGLPVKPFYHEEKLGIIHTRPSVVEGLLDMDDAA